MRISDREGKFVAIPVWFLERMSEISKGATVVYLALRYRAGIHLEEVPASMRSDGCGSGLVGLTGMSRSQIYRALSELKCAGLIEQNGVGMIIKKRQKESSISPTGGTIIPTGGTIEKISSPTGGTNRPTGGTNCPTGGNICPTGGTPSSTTMRFERRERECAPDGAPSSENEEKRSFPGDANPRDFLVWFANRYEEKTGDPYPVAWAKDSKVVGRLFETYPPAVLGEMSIELLHTGDEFIREKIGRTIGALSKFAPKFAAAATKRRNLRAVRERNGDGDPEKGYERRIRVQRLREELAAKEERFGVDRAKELHADLYEMVEALGN